MHKGKQVTKKPQKVGVPQKKGRSEEGKGGEPAVPCRERLQPGAAAANDKRGLTRLGSTRRWAWRQRDRAAQRQRDGQDTHRSAPLIVLAPSEKIQLPRVLPAGSPGTRAVRGNATGDTHNSALQGQTCKLLRTPVRQVGEA